MRTTLYKEHQVSIPVWSIFADLDRPLSPKLPDKGALSILTYIEQG